MQTYGFSKDKRLLTKADYQALRGTKLSASDHAFLLLAKLNADETARLGLAISKKNAKHAVQRNRIKRIVRESFRHHCEQLPALDILVLARKKTVLLESKELRQCIDKLWFRLAKRASSRSFS